MKHSVKRISAKDVAAYAGVSPSTVSRVLNDNAAISDKTKKAVQNACKELHYVPNISARSLSGYRSNSIAVIIPDISDPNYASMCAAIERCAADCNFHILLIDTLYDPDFELVAITRMLSHKVDGFLIASCSLQAQEQHASVLKDTPCIYIGENHNSLCSYVESDNNQGAYGAAQYLYHLGHRRIAFIGGTYGTRTFDLRINGYRRFMQDNKLSCYEIIPRQKMCNLSNWYTEEITHLLTDNQMPDAFLVYSDIEAIHIMGAARHCGIHIPNDISVVSFDDIPIGQSPLIGLTTVTMHTVQLGRLAVQRLVEKINGSQYRTADIVQPELMIRSSSRKK